MLPVAARELVVRARHRMTHGLRVGCSLSSLLLFLWIWVASSRGQLTGTGQSFFSALSGVVFLFVHLCGIWNTSDTISSERRNGTLRLLFLTDLKGFDVIIGKLVGRGLNTFYGILAILPVLALSLLTGGVTAGEFWRMAIVLVSTLIFSLSLGIVASTCCRTALAAGAVAVLLILGFGVAFPVSHYLIPGSTSGALSSFVLLPSPAFAYWRAAEAQYGASAALFWIEILVLNLISAAALFLASKRISVDEQDLSSSPPSANRALGIRLNASIRNDASPYFQVVSRRARTSRVGWVVSLSAIGLAVSVATVPKWAQMFPVAVAAAIAAQFVFRFAIVSEAARTIAQDREQGALEILLCTPLAIKSVIHGQMQMIWRLYGPPVALLLAGHCFLVVTSADPALVGPAFILLITFLVDLCVLAWLGMWLGLREGQPIKASIKALRLVIGIPAGVLVFFVFSAGRNLDAEDLFYLWGGGTLVVDLFLFISTRAHLFRDFRRVASEGLCRQDEKLQTNYSLFSDPELKPLAPSPAQNH